MSSEMCFSLPDRLSFALMGSYPHSKYQTVHPVLRVFLASGTQSVSHSGSILTRFERFKAI